MACLTTDREKSLAMIVICRVVAMTMHRPVEVLLKPVRVAMRGHNLKMVLNGFKNRWRMRCRGGG